jgi:carbon monoxide dehydrogenase subunit G
MSSIDENKLVLKGEVKRAYSLKADPMHIFEYLSDMRILLKHVPNVTRVQLRTKSGRARLFLNITVMAFNVNAVLDVEPTFDPDNHIIRLSTPAEPLGTVPLGHVTGTFTAVLKVSHKDDGDARVSSHLILGFDANQIDMLSNLSRGLLESTGQVMLQDYVDRITQTYINSLAQDFPRWLRERKEQPATE